MPVIATPSTPIVVTIDQVRMFLRDRADRNILLDDVDFSTDELNQALEFVVSAYNSITPQTSLLPQSFPTHLKYVLLLGCGWYLMRSQAHLQIRNQATVQDGSIAPIGIDDKYSLYLQLSQTLKQEWDELARAIKMENNLAEAYGSLSSGYRFVTRNRYT